MQNALLVQPDKEGILVSADTLKAAGFRISTAVAGQGQQVMPEQVQQVMPEQVQQVILPDLGHEKAPGCEKQGQGL